MSPLTASPHPFFPSLQSLFLRYKPRITFPWRKSWWLTAQGITCSLRLSPDTELDLLLTLTQCSMICLQPFFSWQNVCFCVAKFTLIHAHSKIHQRVIVNILGQLQYAKPCSIICIISFLPSTTPWDRPYFPHHNLQQWKLSPESESWWTPNS